MNLEKGMAIEEVISILTRNIVQFCIHLLVAIAVFYLGRFLINRLYRLVKKILTKRQADPSIASFVLSGVQIVLYFLLIIVVVGIMGIETSSFIALFASAGVAVGMALSGTLQNFAGGVLILCLRPYRVGDFIEAQGFAGTVKEIQLFNTLITTPDNKTIIIPNGPLFTGSINNYSRQPYRRIDWDIDVAYGTDFAQARQTIADLLADDPRVIKGDENRPIDILLKSLNDSSITITVRAWADNADYWPLFFAFNEQVYKALPQNGIHFPFPQLDVHMS